MQQLLQPRIEVDNKLLGDPIEVAALRGIGWSYQPSSCTASPSNWRAKEITIARQKEHMGNLKDEIESDKKEKEEITKKLAELEKSLGLALSHFRSLEDLRASTLGGSSERVLKSVSSWVQKTVLLAGCYAMS